MSESLNSAVALYAAGLGAWALVSAIRGAALTRGQLAALVALELGLALQAVIALVCIALAVVSLRLRTTWGRA